MARLERLADEVRDGELGKPGRHPLAAVGGGDGVLRGAAAVGESVTKC